MLGSFLERGTRIMEYEYMKIQAKERRAVAVVKIGVSRQVVIPKKLHA